MLNLNDYSLLNNLLATSIHMRVDLNGARIIANLAIHSDLIHQQKNTADPTLNDNYNVNDGETVNFDHTSDTHSQYWRMTHCTS